MEEKDILQKAGLSEAQAQIYSCLLKEGAMTPAELSSKTNQSRENCYMVTKKLVELNLIEQTPDKKAKYRVLNPSNLEVLAEKRRKVIVRNEKFVKDNLSFLLDIFYANNEMPGARTLEGIDGIKEVYLDIIRTKKDVYFLRTEADERFWGHNKELNEFLDSYRKQRVILGMHVYALTPAAPNPIKHVRAGSDNAWNFERVWMPRDAYSAPTEVQVYGDKVALIAYGETQMATIIASPAIAEAMRQILKIMMDYYKNNFKQEH